MKPSGSKLFYVRRLLITDSVSLLISALIFFLISSWFSLSKLYVSRNVSISRLSVGIQLLIAVSHNLLYLCGINCDISSFFLILLPWILSLKYNKEFVYFIYSKNKSLYLFCSIFNLHSIYFWSLFPSSHKIWFNLFFSSSSLGYKVILFIWVLFLM